MKIISFTAISLIATVLCFSSCSQDKFTNWKELNDAYYNGIQCKRLQTAALSDSDSLNTTASGLKYVVLDPGWNYFKKVEKSSDVSLIIRGQLIDGSIFQPKDTSDFLMPNLVQGLQEGLSLFHVGATCRFYVPSNLGYGTNGNGNSIPPHSVLIFDVTITNAVN
jgi:FKBP-type peptidyl-prolyl cis-trans isomerase